MQEAKGRGLGARLFKRYGLDALSAMALGLFSTLIIGTILDQLGQYVPGLSRLSSFAATAKSNPVVGGAVFADSKITVPDAPGLGIERVEGLIPLNI